MLQNNWNRNHVGIFFGLVLLMLLTRTNHFGASNFLPDASLAVFFFAGICLRRFVFPVFLLLAGLIDYIVIEYGGVSSWCVTPAYLFLIPTYAVMWELGRFADRRFFSDPGDSEQELSIWLDYMKILGCVFVATSLAFLISNYGFYAFSERFEVLGPFEYLAKVTKYFPAYVLSTILYSVLLLVLHAFVQVSARRRLADKF